MADRQKLIDALELAFPSPHLLDLSGLDHTAAALIEGGWRHIPTSGEAFDAAVEQALAAFATAYAAEQQKVGLRLKHCALVGMAAALRASLNPGGDDA